MASWIEKERPELAHIIYRNIQVMRELRRETESHRSRTEILADAITRFTGSMPFVLIHALGFAFWIVANLNVFKMIQPWDPFPFVMLAVVTSVEAIFLSTFILITQNRMAELNERHAELGLQITLLSEHEVTRLISMVDGIARHLNVPEQGMADVEELKKDVEPEQVMREIKRSM